MTTVLVVVGLLLLLLFWRASEKLAKDFGKTFYRTCLFERELLLNGKNSL